MQVFDTSIEGVKIIVPMVIGDERGFFVETYSEERYREAGVTAKFVQDNVSCSRKGVVRGLHWQAGEACQAKLVQVIKGSVWDVAVDIRKDSPTFGKYVAETLTAENHHQLYIPRGFAHGFIVLEDDTLFSYKCDNYYDPKSERGLRFDDPALGIKWPECDVELRLSEKDKRHPVLSGIEPYTLLGNGQA